MLRFDRSKLGPSLCLAACLCAGVAVLSTSAWTTGRRLAQRVSTVPEPAAGQSPALPAAAAAQAPRTMPSTAESAAAGNAAVARNLARTLSRAAASGNDRAVNYLLRGLPRFGDAARKAIEEELSRVKDPRARDALRRALEEL